MPAQRYFGLDVHKYYLIAIAVDADLNKVYGPRRVELSNLGAWIQKTITPQDAVVLEMTANAWQLYDELLPCAQSVMVVHPPHVALIVRAQVMNDKIAALQLARLLAKGLLVGIWVPPQETRDLRTLVAQRNKMARLKAQAKCRLQATLHRYHLLPPENGELFSKDSQNWWLNLPVGTIEKVRIESDLETLAFAQGQIERLEKRMAEWAVKEPQIPRLMQLAGVGLVTSVTLLAAIGDIRRFPSPSQLVGYAGLGARVHDSGMSTRTGGITKAGRKDVRGVLAEAAQVAVIHDPRWKAEMQRLEPRLGHSKAIIAVARKMLVLVWHLLSEATQDRKADPDRLARKFLEFAYVFERAERGQSAQEFVRERLDLLGIGREMEFISQGKRRIPLPKSSLPGKACPEPVEGK
jgi:transposase